jgi:hypothetical protein
MIGNGSERRHARNPAEWSQEPDRGRPGNATTGRRERARELLGHLAFPAQPEGYESVDGQIGHWMVCNGEHNKQAPAQGSTGESRMRQTSTRLLGVISIERGVRHSEALC